MHTPETGGQEARDDKPVDREIERKFLIRELPPNLESYPHKKVDQGYTFISDDGTEIRVRRKGDVFYLTGKSGAGQVRIEKEREISETEFEQLWSATAGRRLEKTRYEIPLVGGNVVELDVYGGDLTGLVTAETEFPDAAAAAEFAIPEWLGEEVTEDKSYKNQTLAVRGRPGEQREKEIMGNPEYDIDQGIAIATALIEIKKAALERPVIVEIAGGSASGKTFAVSRRLSQVFGDQAGTLSLDHYYYGGQHMAEQKALGHELNFDQPESVDLPLVAEHLRQLRNGQTIEQPVYSFKDGGVRTGSTPVPSKEVIIAEGLFTLDEQLADLGDVKIYVDIGTHGQFLRRLMRDVIRLDWTPQQIMDYFSTTVAPMHEKYVATTKANADIVIRNEYRPAEEADRAGSYEQQLKFPGAPSAEQLQRLGAEVVSQTTQVDHYLNPHDRELTSSDEMLRIRDEGETKTITYKGPKKPKAPYRQRPKFEFAITPEIQDHFLKVYGHEFETITKERTLYRHGSTLFSIDRVKKTNKGVERDLGTWTEVRFAGDATPEDVERITREIGLDPAAARKESYVEL